MEIAWASSNCGTGFRSVWPGRSAENISTKILVWMNKTGTTENLAQSIIAPLVHEKNSHPKSLNAEKSNNERQFSAHTRDSKHPVQPTITTKAAVQDSGKDNENW